MKWLSLLFLPVWILGAQQEEAVVDLDMANDQNCQQLDQHIYAYEQIQETLTFRKDIGSAHREQLRSLALQSAGLGRKFSDKNLELAARNLQTDAAKANRTALLSASTSVLSLLEDKFGALCPGEAEWDLPADAAP